jgi:hypothetical protein
MPIRDVWILDTGYWIGLILGCLGEGGALDVAQFRTETGCIPRVCRSRTSNNERLARERLHGSCDRFPQCKLRLSY